MPKRLTPITRRLIAAAALAVMVMASPVVAIADTTPWAALTSGGHAVLMRHAIAPGTGDPDNFDVNDCATQRNLSDAGRRQATRIGERFRDNGVSQAKIYSSQWCRCLETARNLALGDVTEQPSLNSFFGRYHTREEQTAATRDWLKAADLSLPTVLVTHQVNITALTGVYPSSGELIFVKVAEDGALSVTGRIKTE